MPRATCRCGQELNVPEDGTGRAIVVCPKCNARVRVRVGKPRNASADGFIRFFCTCGRRLKVGGEQPPKFGKCPDCGKVVPVPTAAAAAEQPLPPNHPETPTEELSAADIALLEAWTRRHVGKPAPAPAPPTTVGASSTGIQTQQPTGRVEAGLRVCPKCGKPLHLSAVTCRDCGAAVPKR